MAKKSTKVELKANIKTNILALAEGLTKKLSRDTMEDGWKWKIKI